MESYFQFFKGRVALYAVLKAIGIKPGDEVILPGFTCIVVPNAIIYTWRKTRWSKPVTTGLGGWAVFALAILIAVT
jgi:hypothetical protein